MKIPHVRPSAGLPAGLLALCLCGVGPAYGQQASELAPAAPQSASPYFDAAMKEASRLYDDLEYEQSLSALTRAKRLARTEGERSTAAIYEGLVLADLGRRDAALASFRAGLRLAPEAKLPVKVSPKVEGDFEAVRQEVRRERAALAVPKDAPVLPVADAPPGVTPPVAAAPESAPGVDLTVDAKRTSARRVPTVSWVLLGTGVVAGGVGTVFGLQSRGNVGSAREAGLDSTVPQHLEDARGQAVVANILFGAALAAAAGAATTYFLGGEALAEVKP